MLWNTGVLPSAQLSSRLNPEPWRWCSARLSFFFASHSGRAIFLAAIGPYRLWNTVFIAGSDSSGDDRCLLPPPPLLVPHPTREQRMTWDLCSVGLQSHLDEDRQWTECIWRNYQPIFRILFKNLVRHPVHGVEVSRVQKCPLTFFKCNVLKICSSCQYWQKKFV